MKRERHHVVEITMEFIGNKWKILILRELMEGTKDLEN